MRHMVFHPSPQRVAATAPTHLPRPAHLLLRSGSPCHTAAPATLQTQQHAGAWLLQSCCAQSPCQPPVAAAQSPCSSSKVSRQADNEHLLCMQVGSPLALLGIETTSKGCLRFQGRAAAAAHTMQLLQPLVKRLLPCVYAPLAAAPGTACLIAHQHSQLSCLLLQSARTSVAATPCGWQQLLQQAGVHAGRGSQHPWHTAQY